MCVARVTTAVAAAAERLRSLNHGHPVDTLEFGVGKTLRMEELPVCTSERWVRDRVALQTDGSIPESVQLAHGDVRHADERPQLVVRPVEDRRDACRLRPACTARREHAPVCTALVRPPDAREERLDALPLDQREEPLLERTAFHSIHPEPVRPRRLRDEVVYLAERLAVADIHNVELRKQGLPVVKEQRQQVEDNGAIFTAIEAEAELLRTEISS